MSTKETKFFDLAMKSDSLILGDFTLKSGKKSDYYIDMRDVYSIPELRSMIISSLL